VQERIGYNPLIPWPRPRAGMQQEQRKKSSAEAEFFVEYGDANEYKIQ